MWTDAGHCGKLHQKHRLAGCLHAQSVSFCKGNSHQRQMSETGFCYANLVLHLRVSESLCSSYKNSKFWWCQEILFNHLCRESWEKFSPVNLDFISILRISRASKTNFPMCLVGCQGKGQHRSHAEAEEQHVTHVSNCSTTTAWNS